MPRTRPPSEQTISVLLALAANPASWRYGYDLCQQIDLKAGTLYPILIRLADREWLETKWESDLPSGRPPRHLYRLTKTGLAHATEFKTAKKIAIRNARRRQLQTRMGGA